MSKLDLLTTIGAGRKLKDGEGFSFVEGGGTCVDGPAETESATAGLVKEKAGVDAGADLFCVVSAPTAGALKENVDAAGLGVFKLD